MGFGWFSARTNPIAVDIGTDSIKLLQVEPREAALRLCAAAAIEMPEAVRNSPQQRETFCADAIREAIATKGFKGRQVVTCLPANQMAVQHLRMAKMTAEELQKALPFEAQGKLPFDASRAVLKHALSGEVYQNQEAKQEVILMAAPRESVDRHLSILSKAKLDVVGIHVEPHALIECFGHLFRRKTDVDISTMFVDIGAGSTHVVIAHGKQMVFAKHVQIGGDMLNRKVADATSTSLPEARELRVRMTHEAAHSRLPVGVVDIGTATAAAPNGLNGDARGGVKAKKIDEAVFERIIAALEEPVEVLVTELLLCVRYYESIFPGKQIDRVIFVGGESRHVSICQTIAQRLALPATLGDPMARLLKDEQSKCGLDVRQPQPGWAVAVGLAIGVTGEHK
jgi:type IV pilus assembly protein PilM